MVGAGLVGLATAYRLLQARPELRLAVIDKEPVVAAHQSGHNSGVLHAGVYYVPGSLKARLCVAGKSEMESYASDRGIPFQRCGKLIVAADAGEFGRLQTLYERGVANGVSGVRMIGPEEMQEYEPHAVGVRAVHVPPTGIIDFTAVARSLAEDVTTAGGRLLLGRQLTAISAATGGRALDLTGGDRVTTRLLVTCAGLHSDRIAALTAEPDGDPLPSIVPFRGDYYSLVPSARHLVHGLIYPVPDPALPFLGVHLTRRHDGEVWAGPNAVLALAREGYRRRDVVPRDVVDVLRSPGFRRLARRYWRVGAQESWRDVVKKAFLRDLQRYVPSLRGEDLVFGPSGVRAQAVDADGSLVDDFRLAEGDGVLHVLNAPSPAATASLAIGGILAARAVQRLTG
ncbi:MAG: L-2-hydroxyglutarate oxidase [Frankiaceae bacterium]